jgi:hypothetical protein
MRFSAKSHAAAQFSKLEVLRFRATVSSYLDGLLNIAFVIISDTSYLYLHRGCIFDDRLSGDCNDFITAVIRHDDVGRCSGIPLSITDQHTHCERYFLVPRVTQPNLELLR